MRLGSHAFCMEDLRVDILNGRRIYRTREAGSSDVAHSMARTDKRREIAVARELRL
jgi:hypothetical protein